MEVRGSMWRERRAAVFEGETKTKEALAQETDINYIVERFKRTGAVVHLSELPPQYGDFADAPDLKAALDLVGQVGELFDDLPAPVRSIAENDPLVLAEMMETAEGRQALLEAENSRRLDSARGSLGAAPGGSVPSSPGTSSAVPPEGGEPPQPEAASSTGTEAGSAGGAEGGG